MSFTTTDRIQQMHPILRARTETQALVMIVTDNLPWGQAIDAVCDFFGLGIEVVPSDFDLWPFLQAFRPVARQSGCESSVNHDET